MVGRGNEFPQVPQKPQGWWWLRKLKALTA